MAGWPGGWLMIVYRGNGVIGCIYLINLLNYEWVMTFAVVYRI